jgi:hypothetical protein
MRPAATLLACVCLALLLACGGGTPRTPRPTVTGTGKDTTAAAPNEYEKGGLVLLKDSLRSVGDRHGGEITGTVVNRSGRHVRYAQITFGLYDASGAKVCSATTNVTGLAPGERWSFKAVTFRDFHSFRVSGLSAR